MPGRRKAGSGKATTGRQKRMARKSPGPKTTDGPKATAAEIQRKTPTPKSKQPKRDSLTERPKRKSGIADSAITEPKPKSNRTTPKQKTAKNKGDDAGSSGQKPAVRKRSAAPRPAKVRTQNIGGKQASTTARRRNTSSKISGS